MAGQAEREKLLALTQYPCLAPSQSSVIEEESNIKRSVIRGPIVVRGELIRPDNMLEKDSGALLVLKTTKTMMKTSVFIVMPSISLSLILNGSTDHSPFTRTSTRCSLRSEQKLVSCTFNTARCSFCKLWSHLE